MNNSGLLLELNSLRGHCCNVVRYAALTSSLGLKSIDLPFCQGSEILYLEGDVLVESLLKIVTDGTILGSFKRALVFEIILAKFFFTNTQIR